MFVGDYRSDTIARPTPKSKRNSNSKASQIAQYHSVLFTMNVQSIRIQSIKIVDPLHVSAFKVNRAKLARSPRLVGNFVESAQFPADKGPGLDTLGQAPV
jgi:hypothetical protein